MCSAKNPDIPRIVRADHDTDFGPISDSFDDFDNEPYIRIRSHSTGSRPVRLKTGDGNKSSSKTNSMVDIFKSYLSSRSPQSPRPQTPNSELQLGCTSTSSLQVPVLGKSQSTGDISKTNINARLSDTHSLFPDLEVKIAALAIASKKPIAKQTLPVSQVCKTAETVRVPEISIEQKHKITDNTQNVSAPGVNVMGANALSSDKSPSSKRRRPFNRDVNILAPSSW